MPRNTKQRRKELLMPEFVYEPKPRNDRSALSAGWHPGFLVAITDGVKPPTWRNADIKPRIWLWHYVVWEVATLIGRQPPEHLIATSEQTFSPGGAQFSASKAWTWTRELLDREIQPAERVNLDALARQHPIPCRVKIERNGEWANIKDVESARKSWVEGATALTPEVRMVIAEIVASIDNPQAQTPPSPQQAAQPAQPQPGMQSWGSPPPQPASPPQAPPPPSAPPRW
jgi:hypothetical protein